MFGVTKKNFIFLIAAVVVGVAVGILVTARLDLLSPTGLEKDSAPDFQPTGLQGSTETSSESAFIKVAKEVYPAVVSITTVHIEKTKGFRYRAHGPSGQDFFDEFFKDFFGQFPEREYRAVGLGSGVIIREDGYILTNYHVVEGAEDSRVTVRLPDGREFKGKIKGIDKRSDLAVVKIEAKNLPVARLGDSGNLEVGQWAIAIGNPFAFILNDPNPTMTVGVISALNRTLPQTMKIGRYYGDLIQTDAAINRGNSGGPLVNIDGEVIGISVAIFTTTGGNQGIGFAIPINTAREVLDDLIEGKKVLYGWLGVKIQNITPSLAEYFELPDLEGALVAGVLADSPAEAGGLKDGDIIRTFDGEKIKDTQELVKRVARTKVGKKVVVGLIREKKSLKFTVKIGERPTTLVELGDEVSPDVRAWRGLEVTEITPELAQRFDLSKKQGIVVSNVRLGSPAEEVGIRPGDVIEEINRARIKNLDDYNRAISKSKGNALIRTDKGYFILKKSEK